MECVTDCGDTRVHSANTAQGTQASPLLFQGGGSIKFVFAARLVIARAQVCDQLVGFASTAVAPQ